MAKIKLMPSHGQPETVHIDTFDHTGKTVHKFYASQLKPLELDAEDPFVHTLQAKHGWVKHEPRKVPDVAELSPERATKRMRAPKDGPRGVTIEREDGTQVLYPGRGEFDADAADAKALLEKGAVEVLSGTSRPSPADLQPGTRHRDTITGQVHVVGADGAWHPETAAS